MVLAARATAPAARFVGFAPLSLTLRSGRTDDSLLVHEGWQEGLELQAARGGAFHLMRIAIVTAATAAGLIGLGIATGALLVVATVAAERTLVRGVSGRLLGRK
jgi:hypothetical protein